ncbi:MAG: Eco57I restriction-modification methylase domain-containing protein, partial [Limisphaerales bacterium]
RQQKFVADAWCAAFVWPKSPDPLAEVAPTNELWRQMRDGQGKPPALTAKTVEDLAAQYRFFHWHLQFPQVFAKGGFDVVLGNPPWERININQKEWFANRAPEVSSATNVVGRSKQIEELSKNAPELWAEWAAASRSAEAQAHFSRASGRYPLCAHGDINSYSLFAELNHSLVGVTGFIGCILPSGIATDNSTRNFFASLMHGQKLKSLFEFENEGFFSAGKGHMLRFALTVINGSPNKAATDFFFQGQNLTELCDPNRHFTLTGNEIELINPNSKTCPIFRFSRDADITKEIYRRVPVLQRDDIPEHENAWLVGLGRTLHMGDDAALFRTRADLVGSGADLNGNVFIVEQTRFLPLYEAKMVYQFDHRYGDFGASAGEEREHSLPDVDESKLKDPDYVPLPFYWVSEAEVEVRLLRRGWSRRWLMGWRDVTDARASLRTVIAAVFPRTGTSDKLPLILPKARPCELLGVLSSFVFDYCARQKLGGVSLKQFVFKQLPVPLPSVFAQPVAWIGPENLGSWVVRRVIELTYNSWDLEPFASDV